MIPLSIKSKDEISLFKLNALDSRRILGQEAPSSGWIDAEPAAQGVSICERLAATRVVRVTALLHEILDRARGNAEG